MGNDMLEGDKLELAMVTTAGMMADKLRPIVLGGESACLDGTPMIPLHRGTVASIYMHLERLAQLDGEVTNGAIDWTLAGNPPAASSLAAENERLRKALQRCGEIVERNLYRQHEKIEDVPKIVRAALSTEETQRG